MQLHIGNPTLDRNMSDSRAEGRLSRPGGPASHSLSWWLKEGAGGGTMGSPTKLWPARLERRAGLRTPGWGRGSGSRGASFGGPN
jgi:hypothetical protein